MVELMGRYSNPDIVAALQRVLAGRGRGRASVRSVRSVRQKQRRLGADEVAEVVARYRAGQTMFLRRPLMFIAPRSFDILKPPPCPPDIGSSPMATWPRRASCTSRVGRWLASESISA